MERRDMSVAFESVNEAGSYGGWVRIVCGLSIEGSVVGSVWKHPYTEAVALWDRPLFNPACKIERVLSVVIRYAQTDFRMKVWARSHQHISRTVQYTRVFACVCV